MIKLRTMSTAFLINGEDFLLMKRSVNKKLAPGLWAGVGGHMEAEELNDPQKTCIREISEETGLPERDLNRLRLKYILLRRSRDEIRIQYIYFAEAITRTVKSNGEGELYWIKKEALLDREMSATSRMTLSHYLEYGENSDDILVGTVSADGGTPTMHWHPVQDWECFR